MKTNFNKQAKQTSRISMYIVFIFVLIIVTLNIAQAQNETTTRGIITEGDYKHLEYTEIIYPIEYFENDYNCTHELKYNNTINQTNYTNTTNYSNTTNYTNLCANKTEYLFRELTITQPPQELPDIELIPYERINFEEWNNLTNNEIINNSEITPETQINIQTDDTKYIKQPNMLLENVIVFIVFLILLILIKKIATKRKQIKKENEITPEERAKQLLDAGHNEEYVEEVYDYLKRKQK